MCRNRDVSWNVVLVCNVGRLLLVPVSQRRSVEDSSWAEKEMYGLAMQKK